MVLVVEAVTSTATKHITRKSSTITISVEVVPAAVTGVVVTVKVVVVQTVTFNRTHCSSHSSHILV